MPALGYAAGGLELLIALGGLVLWWMPYLAGVTAPWATAGTGVSWPELHARTYAHTLIVLPRIGDRPRPNLEHIRKASPCMEEALLPVGSEDR